MSEKKNLKLPDPTELEWWRHEETAIPPHKYLDKLAKQIEDDQNGRYEAYREYERLFYGGTVMSDGTDSLSSLLSGELSQNELANKIETLHAQIFKNRVVPGVSTSEADYDTWSRARAYSRWLEGAFDEAAVYDEAIPQAGLDCLMKDIGIIKIDYKESFYDTDVAYVCAERIDPKRFSVDRLEAKNGKPKTFFIKDNVDKWVLREVYSKQSEGMYGKASERVRFIMKAETNDDADLGISASNMAKCDMVTVREVWRIPSGPKAKDGRHVIWIKGCTLFSETWDWETPPLLFIRMGGRHGFYGQSAVKRLAPLQKHLDKLNRKIDEAQDVMGVPRVLVQEGNLPTKAEIDDIPGGILTVKNINAVKEWNAQCATPELYQERDGCAPKMGGLLGISDFESSGQLPPGLRDVGAPFMERYVDQGTARHAMDHSEYERLVVNMAYMFGRMAEKAQKDGYKLVVNAPGEYGSSTIEELNFKEVCVDRQAMKIRVQPMSDLPQSFAGKVEAIAKLRNEANLQLNDRTAMRMMNIPDPNQATDMLVSDEEIIMKNLCHMTKTGEYLSPLPFDNHDLIIQLTTRFINHYRIKRDADLSKVGMLAKYIEDAKLMQSGLGSPDPNAPPVMGDPAMNGAQPTGNMPPPMPGPMGMPMPGPGPMDAVPMGMMPPEGGMPGAGMPGMM